MRQNSAKANALVEAARAELAAKRKVREARFADTVLGWHSDEEIAVEAFPATVIGWDNPAAKTKSLDSRLNALLEEEKAAAAAGQQKARQFVYALAVAIIVIASGFILASLR